MFQKLNAFLFNRRAQKYLSVTPREHRFVNYDKSKSVLLLFESDYSEKNQNIRKLINMMQQDGKKVCSWGFIDKKEVDSAILPDFRILHHKQTDFFHRPLASYLNELQYSEYDLLIDLTLKPVIPLEYVALHAIASFKTGIRKTELPIYDFVMDIENVQAESESLESLENQVDETYLFNQIIFYLKNIQTTD